MDALDPTRNPYPFDTESSIDYPELKSKRPPFRTPRSTPIAPQPALSVAHACHVSHRYPLPRSPASSSTPGIPISGSANYGAPKRPFASRDATDRALTHPAIRSSLESPYLTSLSVLMVPQSNRNHPRSYTPMLQPVCTHIS